MQNMYGKVFFIVAVLCVTLSCIECVKYGVTDVLCKDSFPIKLNQREMDSDGCSDAVNIFYESNQDIKGSITANINLLMKDDTTRAMNPVKTKDGQDDLVKKLGNGGEPETSSQGDVSMRKDKYNAGGLSFKAIDMLADVKKVLIDLMDDNHEMVGQCEVLVCE